MDKNLTPYSLQSQEHVKQRLDPFGFSSGKDLKSALRDEGLPEKKYRNFLKKVNSITKKSLKELVERRLQACCKDCLIPPVAGMPILDCFGCTCLFFTIATEEEFIVKFTTLDWEMKWKRGG